MLPFMDVTSIYPANLCAVRLTEVAATRAALVRTRQSQAPLADVRAAFAATLVALNAAVAAARASGVVGRPLVHELQTARELLILQRRDTRGMDVPDCTQTASLEADDPDGPNHRPGPVGPRQRPRLMHGLDLTAALDPLTREAASQPGPHAHWR
jgi:hypothetical protein